MPPLIVTLEVDPAAQARFDAERRRLFPPGRTQVGAHVTLFHALPGEHLDEVCAAMTTEVPTVTLPVAVTGVRSLGRGAAYTLDCPDLVRLRNRLAARWEPWLTAQDRQRFQPHITVQNKVDPETARATVAALTAAFAPVVLDGTGLQLWRYVGGPWEFVRAFPFRL